MIYVCILPALLFTKDIDFLEGLSTEGPFFFLTHRLRRKIQ